jgi:hypothetical protein
MAYNVSVYKNGTLLGTGSATNGQFTVTTFTAEGARTVGSGRNVQVTATSGSCVGQTQNLRCVTDGGATLTFDRAHAFV